MLIHHFLENSTKRFPDKLAVIHEKTRATYGQVNAAADQLAAFLVNRSALKGGRVVILMENSFEYIVAYYGILKAGGVAVPLSTDLKPDGLNPLLAELEPTVIISSARFERLLQASDLNVPNLNTLIIQNPKLKWVCDNLSIFNFQQATSYKQPPIQNNPQPTNQFNQRTNETNLANIIYTSGSTGTPKGVMLTHGNIVANADSICQYLQLADSDIQMVVLPFFYVMGQSLLNTIFAVGGTLVLNNKFAFPATVINQMIEEKVTLFSGVPSTYAYLLHRSPLATNKKRLTNLRMVTQAGGHMARSIKTALRETLPARTQICIMYGATEASARLTWLDPHWFDQKIDSIGRAIPGVILKILDANGAEVPSGEKGEVVASGPNITRGYWMDPQATARVLDDHGYHTGDIGWRDEEGFIFLEGRKDNLLKVGGHRINPQEVEDALLATELAVEAAVVGVADELLGKRLSALVVPLNGDAAPEAILEKCAALLPKYKMPSELRFVRALPKNANGKVDRGRCLDVFTAEVQRTSRL
ncbi:AMP-dependent ligase [Desulfosarcina widdelii]|uniref:AMP-dependent ligase n=1 Tax=Desulfosarcina widdelii TaxID=947919 RepID=A0A5K7Z8Z4_9BACT|nr:class I adenylate-forming enzyme family protein [Desulfosarcina widdelii]BBO72937.1 AMP-dependent ligase [Desulfosarcina widdelii]